MSSILAESKNIIAINEYEKVFLNFKNSNKRVYIGDFYGNPQVAVISKDESFCVMAGCGLIIYYIKEPFEEFSYNELTSQWKELFREEGKEWWIEDVAVIDNSTIIFTVEEDSENGGRYKLNIDDMKLIKFT